MIASLSCRTTAPASAPLVIGGEVSEDLPAVGMFAINNDMQCTATLISPTRILTAAHCINANGPQPAIYTFHIGPDFENSVAYSVATVSQHPLYNSKESNYDIAIGELSGELPQVTPVPLIESLPDTAQGQELLLLGYGRDNRPSQGPTTARVIKRKALSRITGINASKLKAEMENVSSCNGDSGGPVFIKSSEGQWQVAGVVSCGDRDCSSYGVYTRVDTFKNFLSQRPVTDLALEFPSCEKIGNGI